MKISFNRPPFVGKETEYIKEAVEKNGMILGTSSFTKRCSAWLQEHFRSKEVLLPLPVPMRWKWRLIWRISSLEMKSLCLLIRLYLRRMLSFSGDYLRVCGYPS